MRDPVVCADGHTYDRLNIEQWFAGGRDTSPDTKVRSLWLSNNDIGLLGLLMLADFLASVRE